jgi:phosphoribosylformylglycinamidine synthase
VPPTLLVSAIGVIPDAASSVSIDLKFEGDIIYLLGDTHDELGGSEYFALLGFVGNSVPKVEADKNKKLYQRFYKAVQKGLVASAIPVLRGGLGIALAKSAMAGGLGASLDLAKVKGTSKRADLKLFSESQGRILVSVAAKDKKAFESIMQGTSFAEVGQVGGDKILITERGKRAASIPVTAAHKSFKSTFNNF